MSNIKPNPDLHKRRLQVELCRMRLNIEQSDLRLLELDDERAKIEENKLATLANIAELEKQIGG